MSIIIRNPSKIEIRPQSLVIFCGIANSGKSTLAKKLFPGKNIINTDEVLENTIEELLSNTYGDVNIAPDSIESVLITNIALLKSQEFIIDLIITQSQKEDIVIFDSAPYNYKDRIKTIDIFSQYFEHIYLIVVFPDINDILYRKAKSLSANERALGFYYPDNDSLLKDFTVLDAQIAIENIADGVTKAFVITDLNSNIEVLVQ